jgi:hypothetical protein
MTHIRSILLLGTVALTSTVSVARAQDYPVYDAAVAAPAVQLFSADELDNLVAPIALYPDPILAQVFIAATYYDQVDIAARHVRVFGDAAIDNQPWDVSVKAVAHYPPVLNMLAERTDWAAAIGQAYAVQSDDVMRAVQRLRLMAHAHGNLVTTSQQEVVVEREIIRIVPAHPRVVYVPVYDPVYVYHRPVFHAAVHTRYFSFGLAFPIGSWLSYDCDWYGRRVYYDGWRGGGWRSRSRPYIQIVNVYVNPRYQVININRTVVHRTVNYVNLQKHTTVHRNARFDGYNRNIARVVDIESASEKRIALPRVAAGRGAGGGAQRSTPPVVQQQQRNAPPVVQQRSAPRAAQQQQQRSAPPVVQQQQRSAPPVVQQQQRQAPRAAPRPAQVRTVPSRPSQPASQARVVPPQTAPPTQSARPAPPSRMGRQAPPQAAQRTQSSRQVAPPAPTRSATPPQASRSAPPGQAKAAEAKRQSPTGRGGDKGGNGGRRAGG